MRTLTRTEAIEDIRTSVLHLVDDDHSMCTVAARLGVMCNGFRQHSDTELFRRYEWLASRRGTTKRAGLEDLANRWQLARQLVGDAALSCDVQAKEHDVCLGWDGFSDAQLEEFHRTLCGDAVRIAEKEVA